MKKKELTWAELIGNGMAYLQNAADNVAEWGFSRMKKVSEEEPKIDPASSRVIGRVKAAGKKTVGFLGNLGDAYYKHYEELKKGAKKEND